MARGRRAAAWLAATAALLGGARADLESVAQPSQPAGLADDSRHSTNRLIRSERSGSHAALNVDAKGKLDWAEQEPSAAASSLIASHVEAAEVHEHGQPSGVTPMGVIQTAGDRQVQVSFGVSQVDGTQGVSVSSVLVLETRLFAESAVAQERARLCPQLPRDVKLRILAAQVHLTADLVVTLKVRLPTEEVLDNVKVEWTPDLRGVSADAQAALARIEQKVFQADGFKGLLDKGAKLILPKPACALLEKKQASPQPSTLADESDDGNGLVEDEEEDHEGRDLEVEALRRLHLERKPAFGLLVDKEREAYERGIAAQKTGNSDAQASAQFPATFTWFQASPTCLDYIHAQGDCGACFMFAAVDSISDRHCINKNGKSKLGKTDHLSQQMGLLCEPLGRQCSGGWADIGFNFSQVSGIGTETAWPYERKCLSESACAFGKTQCSSGPSARNDCFALFTPSEFDEITTHEDAVRVLKRKCKVVANKDQCTTWADTIFAEKPSTPFLAKMKVCAALLKGFSTFAGPNNTAKPSAGLMEQSLVDEALGSNTSSESWLEWLKKLFSWLSFGDSNSSPSTTQNSTKTSSTGSGTSPGASSSGANMAELCNRSRCPREPAPHRIAEYHYLINTKEIFKGELYNEGPFYTSFWIYEDFTWFFNLWPTEAYNRQWGESLGGHAVVLIGWEGSCTFHTGSTGSSLLQGQLAPPKHEEDEETAASGALVQRSSGQSGGRRYNLGESRRRSATGECWHLRNTWGPNWADKGYFRLRDEMLTGPDGTNIHIASAAGDRPYSTR